MPIEEHHTIERKTTVTNIGQTIENPMSGERFTLIRSGRATGGELAEYEVAVRPGGAVPVAHIHPRQEEEFAVLDGTLRCRVGNAPAVLLGPGERVVIPAGEPHYWSNAGEDELRVRVTFRPALDIETFFRTLCGLANDGKVNAQGVPSFLQITLLSSAHEIYLERPPIVVQKILFAILRPIARLRGLRARYPRYSEIVDEDGPGRAMPGADFMRAGREAPDVSRPQPRMYGGGER